MHSVIYIRYFYYYNNFIVKYLLMVTSPHLHLIWGSFKLFVSCGFFFRFHLQPFSSILNSLIQLKIKLNWNLNPSLAWNCQRHPTAFTMTWLFLWREGTFLQAAREFILHPKCFYLLVEESQCDVLFMDFAECHQRRRDSCNTRATHRRDLSSQM